MAGAGWLPPWTDEEKMEPLLAAELKRLRGLTRKIAWVHSFAEKGRSHDAIAQLRSVMHGYRKAALELETAIRELERS